MRKKRGAMRKISILLLLLLCFTVFSCGGGGDGGVTSSTEGDTGSGSALSQSNSTTAGSAMLQATNLVSTAKAVGDIQVFSVSSAPPIQSIVSEMLLVSRERAKKGSTEQELISSESLSGTSTCTNGGSVSVNATWIGPSFPSDPSQVVNLNGTVTFNSCVEGSLTFNGAATLSIDGLLSAPSKIVLTSGNFTYANTANNDNLTLSNLTITIANIVISGNDLSSFTTTISGALSGTLASENVNIECNNFQLVYNSSLNGFTIFVSGNIKANCIGDWMSISTTKPLFFPYAYCPTDGDITATSGANSVRVIIESDEKINIYFNNNLVQTYNSCNDIKGVCAG